MSEIEATLAARQQCKVGTPEQQVAYRISSVSRTCAAYNGVNVEMKVITPSIVSEALPDPTNIPPIKFLESRGTEYNNHSPQRYWIVQYPKIPSMCCGSGVLIDFSLTQLAICNINIAYSRG